MSATDVHVTVEEIMSSPVETIGADSPVSEAARLLYENRIGSLLVEESGETVGIVTETDVVGLVARGDPEETPVGEIASEALITVERDARIEAAAERMGRHSVKKLPVTDEGAIVGVVTTTDVSNYFPSYHPREESWSQL
jgi:CBS domain-containing protein